MLPNWIYEDKELTDIPSGMFGFIYKLTYAPIDDKSDSTYYYGKKSLYSYRTLPQLKSGENRDGHIRFTYKNGSGKRKYIEEIRKESNWKTYTGSNDVDLPIVKREVLAFARTKRELTYLEVKCLMCLDALEDENCHNENILGTFFKSSLY